MSIILKSITSREREVLHLISFGFTTSDIASSLFITYETAKTHRKNLLLKFGAKNAAVLVRQAFERGFLSIHNDVML